MRSPSCLSDLRIDRLLARDLDASEDAAARAHARTCLTCAARVAAIEAGRAAASVGAADLENLRRAASLPGAAVDLRARARPAPWRRWWPTLGVALAAAALLLVARAPKPSPTEGTHIKGGARLGFFVKHGEAIRRGGPDEPVSPGDVVRFTTTSARPVHLAIIGVDAAGTGTVYYPVNGAPGEVPAGEDVVLPRATALDDTLGAETIHAFFCARPLDARELESARAALSAHPQAPPRLPGCTTDRVVWTKVNAR